MSNKRLIVIRWDENLKVKIDQWESTLSLNIPVSTKEEDEYYSIIEVLKDIIKQIKSEQKIKNDDDKMDELRGKVMQWYQKQITLNQKQIYNLEETVNNLKKWIEKRDKEIESLRKLKLKWDKINRKLISLLKNYSSVRV